MYKFLCFILICALCIGFVPSLTSFYTFTSPVFSTINNALSTVKGIVGLDSFNYGVNSSETDIGYLVLPDGANGTPRNVKDTIIEYLLSDNKIYGLNVGPYVNWSIPYIDKYTYIVNTAESDYWFFPDYYDFECIRFTLQVDYISYDCIWVGFGNRNGVYNDVERENIVDDDYNGYYVSTSIFYIKDDVFVKAIYGIDDLSNFIDIIGTDVFYFNSFRQERLITDIWNELTGG